MANERLILIVYFSWELKSRNTFVEHLYSFEKYSNSRVYYINVSFGVPSWIKYANFDYIMYHYSFLSLRFFKSRDVFFNYDFNKLKFVNAVKVAIPQDEYKNCDRLCEFIEQFNVKLVFSCHRMEDFIKVYPDNLINLDNIYTVLPGYVDSSVIEKFKNVIPNRERLIDIGYRARKNGYNLGELGTLKWKIADAFKSNCYELNIDISTEERDVKYGDSWNKFLGTCRCVLGVESGSSLLDFDGSINDNINKFIKINQNLEFDEIRKIFFKNLDGNISLATISSRHFEAGIAKCCQILIEGSYSGLLIPNIHYIPIKKDFSDIETVINLIKNKKYCEKIADNFYNEIINSGKYSYEEFCNFVLEKLIPYVQENSKKPNFYNYILLLRHKFSWILLPHYKIYFLIKYILKRTLIKLNILNRIVCS